MNLSIDRFFETMPGNPHSTLHARVWDHPGAIVDVGCSGWDWCGVFLGRKRVIGLDPDLSVPVVPGAELIQSQLGACDGVVSFQGSTSFHVAATATQYPIWSWKRFANAAIRSEGIAALKINAEGAEWPLLASMGEDDFKPIDQIAVSFHDFVWPEMAKVSESLREYLRCVGYHSREIYYPYRWWLFWKQ